MKVISLVLLGFSFSAWADGLTLKEFDQIKLGELLSRLPEGVATKVVVPAPGDMPGTEEQITFPAQPQGYQFICRRTFYYESPYPSFTACSVSIDPAHPDHDRSYDEIRFKVTDLTLVQAMYNAIPYGVPLKEYYSWERDEGTNYEGKSTDVFHYRFECTAESCLIRFSGISTSG